MGTTNRVIVLIDMDCFYCQVEERLNPQLEGKPIAVVQYNAWRGGGIIAVNYPARDEGVTRHMRGNEAKMKCPSIQLVQVPEVRGKADLTKYRDAGKKVADVLATFTPLLQRASVDEAYLDITEAVEKRINAGLDDLTVNNLSNTFVVGCDLDTFLNNVVTNKEFSMDNLKLAVGGLITEEIRAEVFRKTGYNCSAGIAHNKILAKLVCSLHKPNKQTILPQNAVTEFFETMQIRKIKSLGGKFGQTLTEDFQITTMGQLAKISEAKLTQQYDEKTAKFLYNIARGIDLEPVTTKLVSKSIACCKNFSGRTALTTADSVQHWLGELAEELSERLEKDLQENNRKAKQMVVSFAQEVNKKDVHSSRTHPLVSYETKKIAQAAFEIVKRNCLRTDGSFHLKFLGLSAGHFEDVKKVREITSFFQVGAKKVTPKIPPMNTVVAKCSIVEENYDSSDCDVTDENVYNKLTQEVEENIEDLVFYDDTHRVKDTDSMVKPIDTKSFEKVQVDGDSVEKEKSPKRCNKISFEKVQVDGDSVEKEKSPKPCNKMFSSFFTKYFDSDENVLVSESSASSDEKVLLEHEQIQDGFEEQSVQEKSEVCNECNKTISISELLSHQDYHYALKLSKSERNQSISPKTNTNVVQVHSKQKNKNGKRKIENGNSSIMAFFNKNQDEDQDNTKACTECNKKIKIDEISSHMDYHVAKKIHLEINAVTTPSTPLPKPVHSTKKIPKKKSNKVNNGKSNKSVVSFFKPL